MNLLNLTGTETWGQLVQANRNLRHTLMHVGSTTALGRRIEAEVADLRGLILVLAGTGGDEPITTGDIA